MNDRGRMRATASALVLIVLWTSAVGSRAEAPAVTGLSLGTASVIDRNTGASGSCFQVHREVILALKPSSETRFDVRDRQGQSMVKNPDEEVLPGMELFPLRRGDYTLSISSNDASPVSVHIDAVTIPEMNLNNTTTLTFSQTPMSLAGCFFDVATTGMSGLSFSMRYKGVRGRGGYNIQREGHGTNIYIGYYPHYSSGADGDYAISSVEMDGVRLSPGRYYFALFFPSGEFSRDATVSITNTFAPDGLAAGE